MSNMPEEICPHCERNETDCEANTNLMKNPITYWLGWGLSCDECYYKNHPESDDDDEEEEEEDSEEECCGKHCGETKGLKIGKGWNRYHLNIEEMITEQLWCEYCYEEMTTQKCKGCWEVYPYTDMEYKEGGNFGEAVCCYDQYYCKPCIVSINKIPYIEGEWD